MGSESFQKREREKRRQERAAERRERRETRKTSETETETVDVDALMERFRVLSEQHACNAVDDATYEAERLEIFTALGLEDVRQA